MHTVPLFIYSYTLFPVQCSFHSCEQTTLHRKLCTVSRCGCQVSHILWICKLCLSRNLKFIFLPFSHWGHSSLCLYIYILPVTIVLPSTLWSKNIQSQHLCPYLLPMKEVPVKLHSTHRQEVMDDSYHNTQAAISGTLCD